MKIINIHRFTFSIILPVSLIILIFSFHPLGSPYGSTLEQDNSCNPIPEFEDAKQRGAHIFGEIDSINIKPFVQNNIDWITMVPWGVQDDFNSSEVVFFRGDSLDQIRNDSMWKSQIDLAHAAGLKVFMKPHVWLHQPTDGKWRSDVFPDNEEDWKQWAETYRKFILFYLEKAEKNKVELFCIGTEFTRLAVEKPDFWRSLIREIRTVYSGKLTYAANWYKEYEKISFWEELDYIGIQAYFPLVNHKHPEVEDISKGWKRYLPDMESMHKKYNRKILFTELGYKSTADSAMKPWEWIENTDQSEAASTLTQANCFEAFFNTVWDQKWFAGVHIWQLRSDFKERIREINEHDFTPQGKPAEMIIAKGFE